MRPILMSVMLAALSAPAVSVAQPAPPSVVLRHADLDLSEPAAAREMLRRIRAAAGRVCAPHETSHAAILAADACRREAVARGVARLNAPAVTAAYGPASGARAVAWRR